MKYTISLLILAALAFTACKKDDDKTSEDHEFNGTITVTSPAENDTISTNSFVVTGNITGNHEMHGYMVQVFNNATSDVIYENEYHEHGTSFTINETVNHTLTDTTELRLHIEAAGDHEGSVVTKNVIFHYIP